MEGIEVLYGTNRFHFSGNVLLQNLGQFFRREHLALIQSAEMIWNGPETAMARPPNDGQDYSADKRFMAWYALTSLMKNVPEALPNLRYLNITPGCRWYPPNMAHNDILRLIQHVFFQPFDQMIRTAYEKNLRLEQVHIAAPVDITSLKLLHNSAVVESGPEIELDGRQRQVDRLWRALDSNDGAGAERARMGYWVSDYMLDRILSHS